jgi:hypothetical protein
MFLVRSYQDGWSWGRVACWPQQWWRLYIAVQYCSVVVVGTAVRTVMLIDFIECSSSCDACNISEDSSQCSQKLANAPCPNLMNKLHTAPCCSFILPSAIIFSLRFLQGFLLKPCACISWSYPCQYRSLFILASSVIVFERAVADYEVCVSIWRYEVAEIASRFRVSVASLLLPSVTRARFRKRYRPTSLSLSFFLSLLFWPLCTNSL